MKKIIAMLLCVAMVAALGVSAFAAEKEKAITDTSKTQVWDVAKWYAWLTGDGKAEAATGLKAYANAVGAAKAAAQDQLDAYNKGIKTAAQAVQAAQYAAVAAYLKEATVEYKAAAENALNRALAEFKIELENAAKVAEAKDVLADFGF